MATNAEFNSITCSRIDVVDSSGKPKLTMLTDAEGEPLIHMDGDNGRIYISLSGDKATITMADRPGNQKVRLEANPSEGNVRVTGKDGTSKLSI